MEVSVIESCTQWLPVTGEEVGVRLPPCNHPQLKLCDVLVAHDNEGLVAREEGHWLGAKLGEPLREWKPDSESLDEGVFTKVPCTQNLRGES